MFIFVKNTTMEKTEFKTHAAVEWLETRAKEREKRNRNETAYWHLIEFKKDFEKAKEMEYFNQTFKKD